MTRKQKTNRQKTFTLKALTETLHNIEIPKSKLEADPNLEKV